MLLVLFYMNELSLYVREKNDRGMGGSRPRQPHLWDLGVEDSGDGGISVVVRRVSTPGWPHVEPRPGQILSNDDVGRGVGGGGATRWIMFLFCSLSYRFIGVVVVVHGVERVRCENVAVVPGDKAIACCRRRKHSINRRRRRIDSVVYVVIVCDGGECGDGCGGGCAG